jgi:hypothetical protein
MVMNYPKPSHAEADARNLQKKGVSIIVRTLAGRVSAWKLLETYGMLGQDRQDPFLGSLHPQTLVYVTSTYGHM